MIAAQTTRTPSIEERSTALPMEPYDDAEVVYVRLGYGSQTWTEEEQHQLADETARRRTVSQAMNSLGRLAKRFAWRTEVQRRNCWSAWFYGDLHRAGLAGRCQRHLQDMHLIA